MNDTYKKERINHLKHRMSVLMDQMRDPSINRWQWTLLNEQYDSLREERNQLSIERFRSTSKELAQTIATYQL